MFTGLVGDIGTLLELDAGKEICRVSIASHYPPSSLIEGASIACNGICLSLVDYRAQGEGSRLEFDAGPETLALTTLADWRAGQKINLERALKLGDELGGHLVSGHVDGTATILAREDIGASARFDFEVREELSRFLAPKGSVALDGTSLTVNRVEGERFTCLLIPLTLAKTNWGQRKEGQRVNLEVDMMARYAARLLETR